MSPAVSPIPKGYHTLTPHIVVSDAKKAADFYQKAGAASKIAFEASRASDAAAFKTRIAELRAACNGCHSAYQKTD